MIKSMTIRTITKKCVFNLIAFHEFDKYSQSLNCMVKYLQCKSCGLIEADGMKNHDLSKIYNETYFTDIDTGWKNRSKLIVKFINIINYSLNLKQMLICDY